MKKKVMVYLSAVFLFVVLANVTSAIRLISEQGNRLSNIGNERIKFVYDNQFIKENLGIRAVASSNSIEVIWPEPGYYYITDYMQLEITTLDYSNCSYIFNGVSSQAMEETGRTIHYHVLFDLVDNMASEQPHVLDFKCLNNGIESTAETYFWINITELDKYIIRNDIGDWEYIASEELRIDNEDSILENYIGYYGKENIGSFTGSDITILDNKDSAKKLIDNIASNNSIDAIIKIINGNNVYFFNNGSIEYAAWTNDNKFILLIASLYEKFILINNEISSSILEAYLQKYPSDIRNGICGDGKVDVLNLDGQTEQCDKNSQFRQCSLDIGECTLGNSERKCSSNCKWQDWGECKIVNYSKEVCDGKDNDCDGEIDEGGVCASGGLELTIYSPNIDIYNTTKIQFNITLGNDSFSELFYIDWNEIKPKWNTLCKNCNEYGFNKKRIKSFKEGQHNLTIKVIKGNKTLTENISFFIDSKKPKIIKTEPKQNSFSNGSGFLVNYDEDNVNSVNLNFGNGLSFGKSCPSGKDQECLFDVDLSDFDGQEINYWFEITDIAGNKGESKETKVKVDTMSPIINSFNYNITGKNVLFTFNISEKNFDEINYVDLNDTKQKENVLCSSLKNGICKVKKSFKTGEHGLKIRILDKAGNLVERDASFLIK